MDLVSIVQGFGGEFLRGTYSPLSVKTPEKEKLGYSTTLIFCLDIDLETLNKRINKEIEEKRFNITNVKVRELFKYEDPRFTKAN